MDAVEQQRLFWMTEYERPLWERGIVVAGMDEAGRGPLAGPVVAACVIMPKEPIIEGIDDSKKIPEKKREQLFEKIQTFAISIGIGIISNETIDRVNILNATKMAMLEAANNCSDAMQHVLIDAVSLDRLRCESTSIIKGDMKSYSVAAASIVAKVTRDRIMREAHELYPAYGFDRHKGYGTPEHLEKIREYGLCPLHRRSFTAKILMAGDGI